MMLVTAPCHGLDCGIDLKLQKLSGEGSKISSILCSLRSIFDLEPSAAFQIQRRLKPKPQASRPTL